MLRVIMLALIALSLHSAHALRVDVEAAAMMPEKCLTLSRIHGSQVLNNFFLTSTKILPSNTTPEVMCDQALSCKRLLSPLITSDNQYRKVCKNDCHGNGICTNGVCNCNAGYKGLDCAIERCPGKCSGRGECKLGRCFCEPGFAGDNCEKTLECSKFGNKVCAGHGTCHRGKCYCDPGFMNEVCSQVTRCPADCSNRGFCLHGVCFCPPGWGGVDCSTELAPSSCVNDCSGKGVCKRGKCHCNAGHFGPDCSQIIHCPKVHGKVCGGVGSCHNGQCVCDAGRTGATCSIVMPCPGNGTCSGNGLCLKGVCYCYPGYSGSSCDQETACASGCNFNGVCVDGKCHCLPGYSGRECEVASGLSALITPRNCPKPPKAPSVGKTKNGTDVCKIDRDRLHKLMHGKRCPNACSGVGACINGICACIPGHTGIDCSDVIEPLVCPNKCSSRGVCVFGRCMCLPPYTGADCSITDDPRARGNGTECPKQCHGRGACRRGACACDPGYAGHDCSLEVPCLDNCNGRGVCDRGKCFCYPGFEGGACEKPALCPGGCSAHGLCFYGRCFCDPYYSGEDCSESPACTRGCHAKHGICIGDDTCVCEPGYTGVSCSEKLICPNDCGGPDHGTCMATERGVRCICKDGWMGSDCNQRVDKCPNDCSNKGICLMGECRCQTGYRGRDCSSAVGGASLFDVLSKNVAEDKRVANEKAAKAKEKAQQAARQKEIDNAAKAILSAKKPALPRFRSVETAATQNQASPIDSVISNSESAEVEGVSLPDLSEPIAADTLTAKDESLAAASHLRFAEVQSQSASSHLEGVTLPADVAVAPPSPTTVSSSPSSSLEDVGLQGPALAETQVQTKLTSSIKAEDRAAMQTAVRLGASLHAAMQAQAESTVTAKQITCPNSCSGHGVCNSQTGMCYCSAGFTGSDCSLVDACPNGCSNNGICQNGQCYCLPTFYTNDCGQKVPTNRSIPAAWVTAILCAVTFFIGIIVGRKTLASAALANIMKETP